MDKVRHQTVSSCSIWSLKIPVRCCSFHKKQQIKQHLYSSLFVLWSVLKKGSSLPCPSWKRKLVKEQASSSFIMIISFFSWGEVILQMGSLYKAMWVHNTLSDVAGNLKGRKTAASFISWLFRCWVKSYNYSFFYRILFIKIKDNVKSC